MTLGKIFFRADASISIGSGHVMRCLTLAHNLRERGFECDFLSRHHPLNLNEYVRHQGFRVHELNFGDGWTTDSVSQYENWLGATWEQDEEQSRSVITRNSCDILVVDHYGLGAQWEKKMSSLCRFVLVIDDLANRPHQCEALLDQNLGRHERHYTTLLPSEAHLMIGPRFALLRPDFSQLREHSLARRQPASLNKILVSMGGIDQHNTTSKVIECLERSDLPKDCGIDVIMGTSAPWLDQVTAAVENSSFSIQIHTNVSQMAKLMCDSDLSIGAAGSTSWERCCLGLPSLTLVLAENQQDISEALEFAGASRNLGDAMDPVAFERLVDEINMLVQFPEMLHQMSEHAQKITDGLGVCRVTDKLIEVL